MKRSAWLVLCVGGWMVGCSGAARPSAESSTQLAAVSCPDDTPAQCPGEVPSYRSQVGPIIESRCIECHQAGGERPDIALGSREWIHANRTLVLSQLATCQMPPAAETAPSSKERAILLAWLACGAPNN